MNQLISKGLLPIHSAIPLASEHKGRCSNKFTAFTITKSSTPITSSLAASYITREISSIEIVHGFIHEFDFGGYHIHCCLCKPGRFWQSWNPLQETLLKKAGGKFWNQPICFATNVVQGQVKIFGLWKISLSSLLSRMEFNLIFNKIDNSLRQHCFQSFQCCFFAYSCCFFAYSCVCRSQSHSFSTLCLAIINLWCTFFGLPGKAFTSSTFNMACLWYWRMTHDAVLQYADKKNTFSLKLQLSPSSHSSVR